MSHSLSTIFTSRTLRRGRRIVALVVILTAALCGVIRPAPALAIPVEGNYVVSVLPDFFGAPIGGSFHSTGSALDSWHFTFGAVEWNTDSPSFADINSVDIFTTAYA